MSNPDPDYIGPHTTLTEGEWVPQLKKDGTPGKRLDWKPGNWYTEVLYCERCNRIGSPKRVQYRADIDETLCMSCWNKIRPLRYWIRECRNLCLELRKAIRTGA